MVVSLLGRVFLLAETRNSSIWHEIGQPLMLNPFCFKSLAILSALMSSLSAKYFCFMRWSYKLDLRSH